MSDTPRSILVLTISDSIHAGEPEDKAGTLAAAALVAQHYFYRATLLQMGLNSRLNLAVFHHALNISTNERTKRPVGDLVNHIGVDSDSVSNLPFVLCDAAADAILVIGGECR